MTLKGWKRDPFKRRDPQQIQFIKNWNGYDGKPSLFVYKQDYDPRAWGKKSSEWMVDLDEGVFPKTLAKFKTKAGALRYARAYMRSH